MRGTRLHYLYISCDIDVAQASQVFINNMRQQIVINDSTNDNNNNNNSFYLLIIIDTEVTYK